MTTPYRNLARGAVCFAALFLAQAGLAATATLAWDPNDPAPSGYRIYYDNDDANPPYDGTFINEGVSPIDYPVEFFSGDPRIVLTGIPSCQPIWLAVTAYNDQGESGYSNVIASTFVDKPTVLLLPGGNNALRVTWSGLPDDDTGTISRYAIHYDNDEPIAPYEGTGASVLGITPERVEDDSPIDSITPGELSDPDNPDLILGNLLDATQYHVRVAAHCSAGECDFTANEGCKLSTAVSATSGACPGQSCDDGQYCNGSETCSGGVCQVGADPCSGSGALFCEDVCHEILQQCGVLKPYYCEIESACVRNGRINPGNPCQECDWTQSNSTWSNDDSNTCSDGDPCTVGDYCAGGVCLAGPTNSCEDAGAADGFVEDAQGSDGWQPDAVTANDGAVAVDIALVDIVAVDGAGPVDAGQVPPVDAAGVDAAVADSALADAVSSDVLTGDAWSVDSAPGDALSVDAAASDAAVVDTWTADGDSVLDGSVVPDGAVPVDAVAADREVLADTSGGVPDSNREDTSALPSADATSFGEISIGEGCSCAGSGINAGLFALVLLIGLARRRFGADFGGRPSGNRRTSP